jgi:HEAT repeat protein
MNSTWLTTATLLVSLLTPARLAGQESASQPATRPAAASAARLASLLALIEGQNAPEVRRTGARELLLQRWPETPPRVVSILSGPNGQAKIALASTLAEQPEFLDPSYIEPLMALLADSDSAVREAAAGALAAFPDNGVTPRLRRMALDPNQPRPLRLAAVAALGMMTEREAVAALAAALDDPDPIVAPAALAAMSRATALDFYEDAEAARAWWQDSSGLALEDWQQRQIERLVRKDRDMRRRLDNAEARLAKVLEAAFTRAPDAERTTLLTSYLADSAPTMRLLGLKFAQLHLAAGKTLPPEMQERIREYLASSEPREQAAAIRTVAALRDPHDADRFLEMLSTSRNRDVRLALLNGLGHAGTSAAVEALVQVLGDSDEQCAAETVAAIGRLAERNVLADDQRDMVGAALLREFQSSEPSQVALRERVLWAMGNLADVRCGPVFTAALDRQEAVVVRQAAVKGIAALKNAQLADALTTAVADPDAGVRKTAVEALSQLGTSSAERHVQVLWDRATSPQESDETIRQAAWRGVLEVLSRGSTVNAERWITRLSGTAPQDTQRTTELLERLARMIQEAEPVDRVRLGSVRARLAAQYATLERPAEAIAMYVDALADLHATKADNAGRTALDLLRYSLLSGRYDEFVARALANASSSAPPAALWEMVAAVVEPRLTPEGATQALAMLTAVEEYPPGIWPDAAKQQLQQMRARALQLKSPESSPASQPTSTPNSRRTPKPTTTRPAATGSPH